MDIYQRLTVSLFGDATRIAQALGLDIELPNIDCTDPDYWQATHAKGDPDWCSLLRLDFCEVRFDLEEGIKFVAELAGLPRIIQLVYRLRDAGIPLKDEYGERLVHAMASVHPTQPEFDAGMREAGLLPNPRHQLWWEPSPAMDTAA
jgi:hypothetical protein